MAGTWIKLPPAPFDVGTMLLLTDGAVLAQESGTSKWRRLFPDQAGDYVAGQWRQAQSSRNAPLYFASAVLRDGTVLVAGGEYSGGVNTDLCSAELYDPETDLWVDLPTPDGWTAIGDAPCCVLPDGKLLLGSINDNRCALFDPLTRHWSPTGNKRNASSTEETWTLLPDGSVLTADCNGAPATERFINGTWTAAGQTPDSLVEAASLEIGPAILLPNGRVLALGATGATALFDPTAGKWTAGPRFPLAGIYQLAAKDAPACLLPNGRVLCVAGPVDGTAQRYDGPSAFFEYDPAANPPTLKQLPDPQPQVTTAPYLLRMLLLPTGDILIANGSSQLLIYRPDGAPEDEWRPRITRVPEALTAGGTYVLEGTQLNGLSQACSYGDDVSMATNYPLVRLRSQDRDNTVVFARTANHSMMAVATATTPQFTRLTLSPNVPAGQYRICVVTNGLASAEVPVTVVSNPASSQSNTPARSRQHADAEISLQPEPPKVLARDQRNTEREMAIQQELLWRDLNEVHLLIDFVSGRSDRSLIDLKGVQDPEAPPGPDGNAPEMRSDAVVRKVCEIRFPPQGSIESRACQASFLLTLKDRLNALASPARGLTVAYTSMFAGVVALHVNMGRRADGAIHHTTQSDDFSFAVEAYPQLPMHAARFRRLYNQLPWIALFFTIFTALLYWDVALGNGLTQQIAQNEADLAKLTAPGLTFQPNEALCASALTDTAQKAACAQWNTIESARKSARKNLDSLASDGRHPIGWIVRWLGPDPNSVEQSFPRATEQFVIAVITVMTGYVVPMMFGLLGTLAGLVRGIAAKVRESTLSPRDYRLTLASVPVGLVAGLAVGVIFVPSSAAVQGIGALGVTLSTTSLAFLAGYGAEAFFAFADKMLGYAFRFAAAKPAGPNSPRT